MERERRLRRNADFAAVFRAGRSWSHPLVVVRRRPSDQAVSRIGFSVSRRVGSAVVRNRVRRRLREIVGRVPLKSGFDVVVIARPAAGLATFSELAGAVRSTFERAGIASDE